MLNQVMANNCMYFDTFAKHSLLNSREYAAMLSSLIKDFENRLGSWQKKQSPVNFPDVM